MMSVPPDSFLRFPVLWPVVAGILMVVLALLGLLNTVDMDLWGIMAFGRLFMERFPEFPYRDPFSYTAPNAVWTYHEWGSGVLFYTLFTTLGSWSLFGLKMMILAGIGALVAGCLQWANRHASNGHALATGLWLISLVVGLYLAVPLALSTLRCHLFTYLGFAYVLWALESWRLKEARRPLWLLPGVMLLWANLHGGFIVAFPPLVVYAALMLAQKRPGEAKAIALITGLTALATLINPYGWGLHAELAQAWMHPREGIEEWHNVMRWSLVYGGLYTTFLAAWLGLSSWSWWRHGRSFPAIPILIAAYGVEGWLHLKLAPLFVLTVWCVGFAQPLPRWSWHPPRFLTGAARVTGGLAMAGSAVLLALGTGLDFSVWVPGNQDNSPSKITYPQGAIRFLREQHVTGNLWSTFEWGEALIWTLSPAIRVSLDGRYETLYPESVFLQHRRFYGFPPGIETAFQYPTDHLLVPAAHRHVLEVLGQRPGLRVIYMDDVAVLFTTRQDLPAADRAYPNATVPLDAYRAMVQ